ncbi:MAG: antirestriction protein ArdA [Nanoarchaeota archaeon]
MTSVDLCPRIYVASLADYNNGNLHGIWIDLDENTDVDEVFEKINKMLSESKYPVAEEFAIHDYDDFGGMEINENESIENVVEMANYLTKHGEAFALWSNNVGFEGAKDNFEEAYVGHYDSKKQYAEQFADDIYSAKDLGELAIYIDWEKYADDLFSNDYCDIEGNRSGIYVFRNI